MCPEALSACVLYAPDFFTIPVVRCSPPTWAVQLLLAEKNISHRVEWLPFERAELRRPDFLAMNPRGTVPVLKDAEICVHETLAVLEYLEYTRPDPAFMPSGAAARGKALTRLHEASLLMRAGMSVLSTVMRGGPVGNDDASALEAEFARIDAYLSDDGWVSGDAPGLADLIVFTYFEACLHVGVELPRLANLGELHLRMRTRESVRRTWPKPWGLPPPV